MPQIGDVMMKNMIPGVLLVAAVSGLSSSLHADAVQWRVEDGGNGHWYEYNETTLIWEEHKAAAESEGGMLACILDQEESDFVGNLILAEYESDAWIGGFPSGGGFEWVSGEPFSFSNWSSTEPSSGIGIEICGRASACEFGKWYVEGESSPDWAGNHAIYEWSADCNGDGIVDYGQILDGTFADENANGVPDCCEDGSCFNTIQWRIEDGGNGHWYRLVSGELVTWSEANDQATALGGYLATPTGPDENSWIFTEFDLSDYDAHWHTPSGTGPAIGGFWDAVESAWEWRNGEVWSWNNLIQPLPSDPSVDWGSGYTTEDGVPVPSEQWQHFPFDTPGSAQIYHKSFVVEFTSFPGTPFGACCLDGSCLTTTASDCVANGGSWGGANSSCTDYDCSVACAADIDGNGRVDGADLSIVLGSWGVCP
jgi:hypothetical protein